MRCALVVMAMAGSAHADDFTSEKVGDYTIDAGGTVTKGAIKAPLIDGANLVIHSFVAEPERKRLSFSTSAVCVGQPAPSYKFTFDQLEARIVNVTALKLHQAKKSKEAIAAFERAVKLDPRWPIPSYNLASARNLAGDRAGALAALSPEFAVRPAQTYFQVLNDPDLKSLATDKTIVERKAPTRGTATTKSANYAFSADRSLIAYSVSRSQSYLACVVLSDLEVYDTKTGTHVMTIPEITRDDIAGLACSDPMSGLSKPARNKLAERLAKRHAVIDTFLADLGFNVVSFETANIPRDNDLDADGNSQKKKATFPKSKMYAVVGKNGAANIHRGNAVVGTVYGDQLDYIDAAKYVVGISHNQNEGGCPNETFDGAPIK